MKKYLIDDNNNDNNIKLPQTHPLKSDIIKADIIIDGKTIPIIITNATFEMNNSIPLYGMGDYGLINSDKKLIITGEIDLIYSELIKDELT